MDSPIIKTIGNTRPTYGFIPKQETPASYRRKASSESIFFIIAVVALIVIVSVWGALMLYQYMLQGDRAERDAVLVQKGNEVFGIDKDLINDLQKLDAQLNAVNTFLTNHTSLTPLFAFLSDNTLTDSVRFSSMEYMVDADGVNVVLTGEAMDFSSLAYQEDVFKKNASVQEVSFSGYTLTTKGRVTFTATITFDPKLFSYLESFNRGGENGI